MNSYTTQSTNHFSTSVCTIRMYQYTLKHNESGSVKQLGHSLSHTPSLYACLISSVLSLLFYLMKR